MNPRVKALGICKGFKFEASHQLPNYVGKCADLHGHTYILQVTVSTIQSIIPSAELLDYSGILIDFGTLKKIVREEIIDKYDHKHLNHFFLVPSAEVMVLDMHRAINKRIHEHDTRLTVTRTRLYEGTGDNPLAQSYAEVIDE